MEHFNLGHISFKHVVTDMTNDKGYWKFDFVSNKGEYCAQHSGAKGDFSWRKDIYLDKKEENKETSEHPDVKLIDVELSTLSSETCSKEK